MESDKIIGIDLGGTNARAAIVERYELQEIKTVRVNSSGTVEEVLQQLYELTDSLVKNAKAIGIGVPSVVDVDEGVVYDVQNIPSWKEVQLKEIMEERYGLPVLVNNDANCFALGEKHFGKGKGAHSFVGLTIGTGIGAGIIINNHLYAGSNCGAGEFGMVDYLDKYYEYYASGQFFENVYQTSGEAVFKSAEAGDENALQIFREFGTHLGNAIKMILYTFDPALIIIGGSIQAAYPYYQQNMWERIRTFVYPKSVERLKIELSTLENCGLLGAAALYYDHAG